jgi:hypothetical protein
LTETSWNNNNKKRKPNGFIDNSPFEVTKSGRVSEAFGEWIAVDLEFCNLLIQRNKMGS